MISRSLGIYGWSEMLDNLLVTGIVTGDPILLLSQPGHGKTAFCKRLGKVITDKIGMGTTVRIINVSTARPEDWTGYYLPPKDGGDEMSLVKSPQSLLDAVFIMLDEIGRSETARNQNNLLSLIQDRMIDGIKTKCEILFAAMNPVAGDSADEGSMPLLYSVADRFSMLLEVPDFKIMENNDKMEVVSKSYRPNSDKNIFASSLDNVELGQDDYFISDEIAEEIWTILEKAKRTYLNLCLSADYSGIVGGVVKYVIEVAKTLSSNPDYHISARRAGMIVRSILASYAVSSAMDKSASIDESAHRVIMHSLTNKAMAKPYDPNVVLAAHQIAVKLLTSGDIIMYAIMAEPDKWKRLEMAYKHKVRPDEFTRLYKDVLNIYPKEERGMVNLVIGSAAFNGLAELMSKHELALIANDMAELVRYQIPEISINASEIDSELWNLITVKKNTMVGSNLISLCAYVSNMMSVSFLEAYHKVIDVYKSALKVIGGTI